MRADLVLRLFSKLVIPFVLLFGLYVLFHGDFGPGGGFQAGVIVAAALILHALIFGLADVRRAVPEPLVESMMALGVLLYGGVGIAGLLLGGHYLDYFVLDPNPVQGQHRGIFWVEAGVSITVCAVMLKIFYMFADRGLDGDEADDAPANMPLGQGELAAAPPSQPQPQRHAP